MHPENNPHDMKQQEKRFGNHLNARFGLPFTWLTSAIRRWRPRPGMRERNVSGRALADKLDEEAARVILQQYLDQLSDHEHH
jgi:Predicted endonuclease involved in recombination (possible Holliday junction resolvase in Mycoplasmas and B. subtilis)